MDDDTVKRLGLKDGWFIRRGRPKRSRDATINPTLAELGLTKQEAHRARRIASIPEDQWKEALERNPGAKGIYELAGLTRKDRENPDTLVRRLARAIDAFCWRYRSTTKAQVLEALAVVYRLVEKSKLP